MIDQIGRARERVGTAAAARWRCDVVGIQASASANDMAGGDGGAMGGLGGGARGSMAGPGT